MNFDLQRGPAGDVSTLLLGLVAPRPIALITSMDENGKLNAAPFCAYNHPCTGPPIIGVGLTNRPEQPLVLKDTARNIRRTGEFVGNVVTEDIAETTDWTSAFQYPPYDGQLREDVYTHLSNGANMVEYRHWASIAAKQETLWKGVLSHALEPNRAYAEVSPTAHELEKIGPIWLACRFTTRSPSCGAATRSMPSASCPSLRPDGNGASPRPPRITPRWSSKFTVPSTISTWTASSFLQTHRTFPLTSY